MNPGTLEAKAEASAQLPVPSVHISNASKETLSLYGASSVPKHDVPPSKLASWTL